MSLRSRLTVLPWGATTSAWDGYERAWGYAVMDLPFSSGHVLGLRVFPQTDFGGYVSVWHRDPGGAWAQYVDRAPLEAGCPRVWGPALDTAAPARIGVEWTGPMELTVTMDDPELRWRLEVEETWLLRVLNALHAPLPLGTWRHRALVAVRERLLKILGLGAVSLSGEAPTGVHLVAALREMFWVSTSTAVLDGRDLGAPTVLEDCPTIGGWPLPRRGVLAVGEAHATTPDREEYRRLRRRVLDRG
ncbi:MAG: hypothetical protein R3343_06225 [Nitriliruptorales bacterium]|nr:hypothetical protein [Nitriliruptorales bacterium]